MKLIQIILIAFVLTACNQQASAPQQRPPEVIYVLIENGGTVTEEDRGEAFETALQLLQQITTLSRRKSTRKTQVHIVLSASPNRIAWSGTPGQLLQQAQEVKKLIVFKPSFSDLVMAFDQIETTINLAQEQAVRLYWIGSTVHVPFQETNAEIEVKVPQPVPVNLALGKFADRLSVLKIMRVHPDQDQMLLDYLSPLGVLERSYSGDLEFELMGVAQTRSRIKALL